MTGSRAAIIGILALGALPATAVGQQQARYTASVSLVHTQPIGELGTGPGYGFGMGGSYALDARRIFRIAGDFRLAIYDHENRAVCFSSTVGCRIVVDLTTDYGIVWAGLGPQLAIPIGRAELALDLTGGWTAFSATSRLQGIDEHDDSFGQTTNYEDNAFAWSTGGEMRLPVGRQTFLALGGHYQHNGTMSYLREGGITDNPDGTLTFDPRRTEANLLAFTLGLVVRPAVERRPD